MAVDSPLQHLGWCVADFDARNSSITGTTQGGPNGSYQFCAVRLSTTADLTISRCTLTTQMPLGILQNKPSTGIAADVGYGGPSKCVAGSTAIIAGGELMSDTDGQLIPYVAGASVARIGRAMEDAGSVGQIFTAFIYSPGVGGPLTTA